MRITLPPSLRKDLHPLEEEVAYARSLTPEQRLMVVDALCRDALLLLEMNPNKERVLALRDPLPESSVKAFQRLRARR